MRCKDIEKKLIFFLEGELQEQEQKMVSEHIGHCEGCTAKLQYLKGSLLIFEAEKAIEVKPFLYTRIKARMEPRQQTVRRWVLAPLAVASILVMGLLIGSVAGRLTVQQGTTLVQTDHNVAYLFNDADLESTESILLNN
jgi:anti-sigma factor RsiW